MKAQAKEKLPVELVFAPQWWNREIGLSFDRDFFFHPARRVEDERKMERHLWNKWGNYGLGTDHNSDMPEVGAVHLASGFLLSEMMGCRVDYFEAAPPLVICKEIESLDSAPADGAFKSGAFKSFDGMREALKTKFGYVTGDVNWSGILNLAIDLRGQELFIDMNEDQEETAAFFSSIADMIEKFTDGMQESANSTSISVNRTVSRLDAPVLLHSECSLTMISEDMYREYLQAYDIEWSKKPAPFGVHYCGADPHRFARAFSEIPALDFLDVGWGGDVALLRKYLPKTFLNLRLSPVELVRYSPAEVRETILRMVKQSGDLSRTGICCINMDDKVSDENVSAILETRKEILETNGAVLNSR
ncbi:MAG: hypothetical protein LBG57_01235 [Treponema sp.]|jgi:hypothetical protein|nr:hypothetical protein [Treponema sp.]